MCSHPVMLESWNAAELVAVVREERERARGGPIQTIKPTDPEFTESVTDSKIFRFLKKHRGKKIACDFKDHRGFFKKMHRVIIASISGNKGIANNAASKTCSHY